MKSVYENEEVLDCLKMYDEDINDYTEQDLRELAYWLRYYWYISIDIILTDYCLWDCSGVATNHPYGGLVSAFHSVRNAWRRIFSSNSNTTNSGCWYKQLTNEPTNESGKIMKYPKTLTEMSKRNLHDYKPKNKPYLPYSIMFFSSNVPVWKT